VLGELPPEQSLGVSDGGLTDRGQADGPVAPEASADSGPERDAFDAPQNDAGFDAPDDATDVDPDPCSTPVPWYIDSDRDGMGHETTQVIACPKPPGGPWVRRFGDCDDGDARVFQGQTAYFGTPSPRGSYDFDCSGTEEPNPGQARVEGCGLLSLMLCDATSGYAAGTRSGPGVNAFCGSTTLVQCKEILLQFLVCGVSAQTIADEPFRCN
jgi:hypothetical protein